MQTNDWLNLIPIRKKTISTDIDENGLASIIIPRFNKDWMARLFLPKNKKNEIRIKLDENGTRVWNLISGKETIQDILDQLSDIAMMEENYNDRVILFMQDLHKNGFIQMWNTDNK